MTVPTVWTARRVGDRVLCGRQVAGRYVCQGEVSRFDHDPVYYDPATVPAWMLRWPEVPTGLVASDELGLTDEEGPHYRESARVTKQRARGQVPVGRSNMRGDFDPTTKDWNKAGPKRYALPEIVEPPYTVRCPRTGCRVVNRVTIALVDVLE